MGKQSRGKKLREIGMNKLRSCCGYDFICESDGVEVCVMQDKDMLQFVFMELMIFDTSWFY